MKVSSLHIYPVKSCAGVEVSEAEVFPRGLQHDRRWMIVDADGKFMTQREHPRMALIAPQIVAGGLKLSAPGQAEIEVAPPQGEHVSVQVWKSGLDLPVADGPASEWLSDFIGHACRLVHLPDSITRSSTSERARAGDEVSLADGFSLLIANTASLADLNSRLPQPLLMNRFRPNVVIDGAPPWEEDRWHVLTAGAVTLEAMKPCARCNITQVDQATGVEDGKEPIRTLRKFRFSQAEMGVLFGVNATPRSGGILRRGDEVQITSVQAPPELLVRA